MRNFMISAICLLITVGVWLCFYLYTSSKIEHYEASLDTITKEYVDEEKWKQASDSFEALESDWKGFSRYAAFFLDSSSLNHIDSTFRKIHYYISANDVSNSSGELAYLKGLFISLHKNETLSFENIF